MHYFDTPKWCIMVPQNGAYCSSMTIPPESGVKVSFILLFKGNGHIYFLNLSFEIIPVPYSPVSVFYPIIISYTDKLMLDRCIFCARIVLFQIAWRLFLRVLKIDSCEANCRLLEYSSSFKSEAAKIEIFSISLIMSFKKWRE